MPGLRDVGRALTGGGDEGDSDHKHLVNGSVWMLATVSANALSGLLFWLVAYRIDDADEVGLAVGLFTAVLFTSYATNMGLPVAVARFAAEDDRDSHSLFALGLLYTTVTSAVGAVVFRLVAPDKLLEVVDHFGSFFGSLLFMALVVGMSFALLVEVRLMTMRRWGWVLARVLLIAVIRLPLLAVRPLDNDALWLLLLVSGVPALSGFIGITALRVLRPLGTKMWPPPIGYRTALRFSTVNYVSLLATQGPQFALPVIVLAAVSSEQYAAFYIAWSIVITMFLVPHTIGQVLLVEGGRGTARLADQVKIALGISVTIMGLASAFAVIYPDILTLVYGDAVQDAVPLLGRLMLAGVFWALISTSLNRARVLDDTFATVAITVTFALATLVPAWVLVEDHGIDGAADAWLLGNGVAAMVAAVSLLRGRVAAANTAGQRAEAAARVDSVL